MLISHFSVFEDEIDNNTETCFLFPSSSFAGTYAYVRICAHIYMYIHSRRPHMCTVDLERISGC